MNPAAPSPQVALEGIQAIRERWKKATKGPWFWSGYVSRKTKKTTDINLVTGWGGRRVVMMFDRVGWRDAQPLFYPVSEQFVVGMQRARDLVIYERDYRDQICGINHPDAEAIAAAPEDVRVLLEEVDRLAAQLPYWKPVAEPPAVEGRYLTITREDDGFNFYRIRAWSSDWSESPVWEGPGCEEVLFWMPVPAVPEGMVWK